MANSYLEYTGNGSTTAFSITFDYLDASHIACTVNGVSTSFTLSNGGATATLSSAPANGAAVKFTRTSSQATRLTDYAAGSVLTESDLDTDSKQAFFMGQEGLDTIGSKMGQSVSTFQFDAINKRVTNVADPVNNQDAVTKNYLTNTYLGTSTISNINTLSSIASNITSVAGVASNVTSVAGIAANVTTVAGISSAVSTLAGISSAISSVNSNASNINTVAGSIANVNTVASNISDINTVAADLNEAVSEIETVASDLQEASPEIDTVANNIANVNTVGGISANVTTVAGISSNVTTVAGISAAVAAVNTNSSNINAVNSNSANINTVASNNSNITTVAGIAANVTTVAGANSNITNVASSITNINSVAGALTNINTVAGANANISTVASNISGVNSFADRYRISSSAPTGSLDVGDLYFDTTANELKVYKSSGWAAAGSTVNGTSQRYTYTISGTPTTVTGADANGNTLAYDAGYADVYVNGVRMSGADITITSGTSVVFGSNLTAGDVVDVVAYGTFNVASVNAANIDAGTLNIARIGDDSITNAKMADDAIDSAQIADGAVDNVHLSGSIANSKLTGSGAITINGSAVALGGSVTIGETKPTISSLTPSVITNDPSNVVIAGGNFVAIPRVHAINTSTGIWYEASTVTYTSASSITANFTLTVDSANYRIRVENPDGNSVISGASALNVSDAPAWTTAAGSLGSAAGNFSGTITTVAATGDTVTFTEVSSPLVLTNASQANCALSTAGVITTSDFGGSSTTATLYTFTIRATDAQGQTSDRIFTLQSSFGATGGAQFN